MVGLGNPGPRYAATRHNVGFLTVDALVRRLDARPESTTAHAEVWRVPGAPESPESAVRLIKPVTWMNRSGDALRQLRGDDPVAPEAVLVVVDDIYLPFGSLRLRAAGSDGGHNGLKSVDEGLGSRDYPRLRVGVGPVPEGVDYRDFVTSEFEPEDARVLPEFLDRIAGVVLVILETGVTAAQNAVAASNNKERINKGVGNA